MRRIFVAFLAVFLLLGISSFSFAQSLPDNKPQTEQSKPETKPRLVTAVEIKGNKYISTNNIVSKMKTKVGSPYQETVISDDLKRLYLLGYFGDIKIDTEDYKDGIKVVITVTERPVIEKITFSGVLRLTMKDEKIKEQLKSKETQYLDYPTLSEDTRIIKKLYEKIGYNQAEVNYKVDVNKEANKAKIEFVITEGKKVRVKDILIEGNKSFSKDRILRLMKTKMAWLFNPGVLKDEVLKEDMERIKAFYRRNGFTDVADNYEITSDPKRPYLLTIKISIQEGKKYLVGNVTVQGNKDIGQKEIISKLTECIPGKVFNQEGLKQDVASMQSLYFDRGYISMQVQEATSVSLESGRVDIVYNITENDIAYVSKIKIRGNIKTKDLVIRRELRIHPGDKFDGEKLRRSKERLQNLGFFEDISYDTEDTQAPDKKDLIVDVRESKTGTFSFGGGYSTVDSFVGFVEIEQKNFDWRNFPYFTGGGQNLKFRASFGSITHDYDLSFTEPWLLDYPVSFGFDSYQHEHQRDTDVGYGYDEKVTGGDLRLGKEFFEYLRADLMYRYDSIKISNITDDATNDLRRENGTNGISSITPTVTYDSRDNVFESRKGDLVVGSFECAGGWLGADKDFWKFLGRASHYFPLPLNSVLEIRGRVGLASPYSDSDRVPIYERLFAGGATTVRGYKERALGPVDPVSKDPLGGQSLVIGNIEYTYPLFSFLKAAVFFDIGNVWEKIGDIGSSTNANGVSNSGGFKSSAGLGVRLKTPIGPILLDYGIPFSKASGEEGRGNGRFHFSASHGF